MKKTFLLITFFILSIYIGYAQKGKDGAETTATGKTIVNEYTTLTTDESTGNTFIKVSNSSLNTNGRFAASLAKGDLLMIIQMQGATINGTPKDSTWGQIKSYNNCGKYEFVEVDAVPDVSTINISCSIKNNYTASGEVQVVRVPRYSSLTINTGDTLTCDTWNGTQGGIVAVEVSGSTLINAGGVIDATGKGFRGGLLQEANYVYGIYAFASMTADTAGQKGESIAGYQSDYTQYGGMYGRGAPANGGGGGNAGNSAGGGGANAGNIMKWTGNGNPDTSNAQWKQAWNLEYNGFAESSSSGGGRGGYCTYNVAQSPFTTQPGSHSWGTVPWCYRENVGGKGGRPLDYSTGRLFLGGGGGSGQENNNNGAGGGNGGGMIYIISYGTIGGSGSISSNGQDGLVDEGGAGGPAYGDGSGGAGGGGTIVLQSIGTISGVSVYANGGTGGNQIIIPSPTEGEGGGGGGGGGYIAISNGNVTRQAQGGVNGTTNLPTMAQFNCDGATKGGDGLPNEIVSGPSSLGAAYAGPDTSICSGESITLSASGGSAYSWTPVAGLSSTSIANPVANPTITTIYVVTVSGGSCRAAHLIQ